MPQPDPQEVAGLATIEAVRAPIRRLAERFPDREPIDIALGALYAAHDLARRAGMTGPEAVEWMRTAADVMERRMLDQAKPN